MSWLTEASIRTIVLGVLLIVCLSINYAHGWDTHTDLWTLTMMVAASLGLDFGLSRIGRQ